MAEAESPFKQFSMGPQGLTARAAVDADRTSFAMGGGAVEYMQSLKRQAYSAAAAEGKVWGTFDEAKDAWFGKGIIADQMKEILRQEGTRAGLDLAVKYTTDAKSGLKKIDYDPLDQLLPNSRWSLSSEKTQADAYFDLAQKIASAGGDPLGGNSEILKSFNATMERSAKALEGAEKVLMRMDNKMNPAPVDPVPPGGAQPGRVR